MTDIVWVASSCAMILAVMLIRAVFGKRMSAGLRYALWALVLLRLLIPGTVLSSPVSVESAVTASETISDMEAVRGVRSVSRSESGIVSGVPRASRPRVSAPQTGTQTGLTGGQQGTAPQSGDEATAPQSADTYPGERVIIGSATPERFERIKKAVKLTDILSTIWYCGMAVTAAWFIFVNLRTYLSLRKRRVRLETELNCPVYAVEGISSSCLFLNSVYISKETAENETERRFVLAHENAHRRHGDGFTVLLRSIALILHWYNPLAWTAAILSRRDAELAADAGAIASLGEEERQNYGLTLIGLSARFDPRADICVAATAMTGGKKELKERIKHMAKKTKTRLIIAAAVAALALIALGISFLGCKTSPADPNAGTEPTETTTEAPATETPTEAPSEEPTEAPTEDPGEFVPEGYNAHDYLVLARFFSTGIPGSTETVGDYCFDGFDVKNPQTWHESDFGVEWDNEGRVTSVSFDPIESDMPARLELIGFEKLNDIRIWYSTVDSITVADCPALTDGCMVYTGGCVGEARIEAGFVEKLNVESRTGVYCSLMGDKHPYVLDLKAEGQGRVKASTAMVDGAFRVTAVAMPDTYFDFIGWFDEAGNFVSAERFLELAGTDIAEPISGRHAYTARFAAPPAPTPVPGGDFFCEILPNVPSSIDVDGDGREDTVLIASLGEGNSWEGFEVTVTRAADPAHPLSYITQRGGDGVAMAADCDPDDNRVEILLCIDVESNDYLTCAFRVNEEGDGLEQYEAWFDSSYGKYFYEPEDLVFDHTRGLPMTKRSEILGTNYNVGRFTVTENGIEDITEEYYYWDWKNPDHPPYVLLRDMEVTLENGETRTLHKGDTFRPYSTDHESWAKVKLEDGTIGRVEIAFGNPEYKYPVFINGVNQDEYAEIWYAD